MSAQPGRPVEDLSDEELEHQGTQAHATRNWVFLHGSAEQFATHTTRMLALEQEYLRRHPQRTWQGSGGASDSDTSSTPADPVGAVLAALAQSPGGRMHKLELHQCARENGLTRDRLATLYSGDVPSISASGTDRVITDAGRARARSAPVA